MGFAFGMKSALPRPLVSAQRAKAVTMVRLHVASALAHTESHAHEATDYLSAVLTSPLFTFTELSAADLWWEKSKSG